MKPLVELVAFQKLRKGKLLMIMRKLLLTMSWWFMCTREKLAMGSAGGQVVID